jgi:hypothetical protein
MRRDGTNPPPDLSLDTLTNVSDSLRCSILYQAYVPCRDHLVILSSASAAEARAAFHSSVPKPRSIADSSSQGEARRLPHGKLCTARCTLRRSKPISQPSPYFCFTKCGHHGYRRSTCGYEEEFHRVDDGRSWKWRQYSVSTIMLGERSQKLARKIDEP